MYAILRSPSTQEDAGRFEYFGVYGSLQDAENKRIELSEKSKGYYSVQSFRIFKEFN